jgi:hypothetical protein
MLLACSRQYSVRSIALLAAAGGSGQWSHTDCLQRPTNDIPPNQLQEVIRNQVKGFYISSTMYVFD